MCQFHKVTKLTATNQSFNPLPVFLRKLIMQNATIVESTTIPVTNPSVAGAVPVAESKSAANVLAMRQRIEALAIEREVWEDGAYARSNEMLYALIQKCYELYLDLTNGKGDVGAKKVGFKDYVNSKGYTFKDSTPLTAKIIRCVFGDRDRRRLSTYHTALRKAVADKWPLADVPAKITEFGGVQEISLSKPGEKLKTQDKAKQAREVVLANTLATVSSDKLAAQNNPEKIKEQAVAVVTQNADGSYAIHCVIHGESVVKNALAAYFSQNKEAIAELQKKQAIVQAVATQEQLIENAAAAANADSSVAAA